MHPEHPIIDPAVRRDAKCAWGQLTPEYQEILAPFSTEALHLSTQMHPHEVFEALRAKYPEVIEALDVLLNLP